MAIFKMKNISGELNYLHYSYIPLANAWEAGEKVLESPGILQL
jgi:hypothetical protein